MGRNFVGLAARPGPTDWLNLDIDGVGGVYGFILPAFPPRLKLARDGVVGVGGEEAFDMVREALL